LSITREIYVLKHPKTIMSRLVTVWWAVWSSILDQI